MKASVPVGDIAMPCGCEARGSVRVCTTLRLLGSMMLTVASSLLLTHSLPSAAAAMLRGPTPTVISASRTPLLASKALTVLVSGLTDHTRAKPAGEVLLSTDVDALGRCAVSGRCTVCRKVFVRSAPKLSVTLSVT